jgi:hypothetical protein
MIRLKRVQRSLLADKLADVANVAAGALIFGQTLSGAVFSMRLALLGVCTWIAATTAAVVVAGIGDRR